MVERPVPPKSGRRRRRRPPPARDVASTAPEAPEPESALSLDAASIKSPPPPPEPSPRATENAAARADEREALAAIFDSISLNDTTVAAPLDLAAGDDDTTLFEPADTTTLRFTLPPAYPLDGHATCAIEWATAYRVPPSIKDHVAAAVASSLAGAAGDASIFSAVDAANEAIGDQCERHAAAYASFTADAPPVSSRAAVEWSVVESAALTRRLIYSHHIIAPSKRAGLKECAQILGVTTFVKIGWPGCICLEGPADRVDAFVNHISRWRCGRRVHTPPTCNLRGDGVPPPRPRHPHAGGNSSRSAASRTPRSGRSRGSSSRRATCRPSPAT